MSEQNKPYPVAPNENERNEAVRAYKIMDTAPLAAFNEINNIAAQICKCPVSYISFIEDDRFWFKSKYGLPDDFEGCPREIAFCSITVCGFELVESRDLIADDVFKNFHFVVNDPHFRFYAAMPLVTPDGFSIGTICVMDFEPRELDFEQKESLRRLAQQTMAQLEYRRRIIELDDTLKALDESNRQLRKEQSRVNDLLGHIMPASIAEEMMTNGKVQPRFYPESSILFADVKNFTAYTETAEPASLISLLDSYFCRFDDVITRRKIEKIKTIGDAYLAVTGVPERDRNHLLHICVAALEMLHEAQNLNRDRQKLRLPVFDFRFGIHTGPVIAGVAGRERYCFDIWGDSVNVAARVECSGTPGRIHVSETVFRQMQPFFEFIENGETEIKNKGNIKTWFLLRLKPEFAQDSDGMIAKNTFLHP